MDFKYIDVWHDDQFNTWYVDAFNADDNRVGESEHYYRKVDAVDTARAYLHSGRTGLVCIYGRNGELQRKITKEG